MAVCVLVCVAAGAGASPVDRVQAEFVSAEIVIAPDAADFGREAAQRRQVYLDLVAEAADHGVVSLGALTPSEREFLAEVNQIESRRVLVGIDRVVDVEVDLSLGGSALQIGGTTTTADQTLVWTATLRSEGARAVRAHLTDIALPEGAALYVYGVRGEAFGPYTGSGPFDAGEMWTNSVLGDTITLQLEIPAPVSYEKLLDAFFVIRLRRPHGRALRGRPLAG